MFGKSSSPENDTHLDEEARTVERPQKSFWEASIPVFACGSGLFSDGYINNVCSPLSHALPCNIKLSRLSDPSILFSVYSTEQCTRTLLRRHTSQTLLSLEQ